MQKIVLITGGGRSGKSSFAQKSAEQTADNRLYIATCPVIDEEMAARVRKHQLQRGDGWNTLEEEINLSDAIKQSAVYPVILVDCLTLWINNLMYQAELNGDEVWEDQVEEKCIEILNTCKSIDTTVFFVTNEVGMGIVPENAISRRFRDLSGRCSQTIAAGADEVYLCVSGIPMRIK